MAFSQLSFVEEPSIHTAYRSNSTVLKKTHGFNNITIFVSGKTNYF